MIEAATGAKFGLKEDAEEVDMCQALREMVEDANREGMQQGIEQGIEQGARLIAHRMLQKGQHSVEYVAEMTGLSEEQVRMLKAELQV